jgi:pilus assembly protein Flp/PilA
MFNHIKATINDDLGQGLVEYGLVLAVIAIVAVTALVALGGGIRSVLTDVAGML